MKAAVTRDIGELSVEEIDKPEPLAGEVLVRMVATGVCHTDLSALHGNLPTAMPVVLGHEGAGVVEKVGRGVSTVKPGDHVVCSIVNSCGSCFHCLAGRFALCEVALQVDFGGSMLDGTSRLRCGDEQLYHFFCQSSFAEYAVVSARSAVPVRKDAPLEAGTTFINGHSVFDIDFDAPFGGIKSSGYGGELGPEAVHEYVQVHSITNKRM